MFHIFFCNLVCQIDRNSISHLSVLCSYTSTKMPFIGETLASCIFPYCKWSCFYRMTSFCLFLRRWCQNCQWWFIHAHSPKYASSSPLHIPAAFHILFCNIFPIFPCWNQLKYFSFFSPYNVPILSGTSLKISLYTGLYLCGSGNSNFNFPSNPFLFLL